MQNTYWNGNGAYQADYERLVNAMPGVGASDTVAGELIRAASRLGYDFYNNGMGNNTSGAANFLLEKGAISKRTYATVYGFTRGRLYNGRFDGDTLQQAIEAVVDETVEYILAHPELETADNNEDMFDYEEEEEHFCDECGDTLDGSGCGWLCDYCEEAMQAEEEEDELYDY